VITLAKNTAGLMATRVDEPRVTALAAALHVANTTYTQALKMPNPAVTLDNICDALPEVLPQVLGVIKTTPELAKVLTDDITDRLWAYTVVEHARAEADEGYNYVFDLLADSLKHGTGPQAVRDEVPRVVKLLGISGTVARIWEARDAASGSWAQILDIVLAEIEKGADPHAVLDQTLGLMAQVRAENGKSAAA
jgi:hypothetical protein